MADVNGLIMREKRGQSADVLDWLAYDSIVCGAAATQKAASFFGNTVSSVGKARTNMKNSNQFPGGQDMLIYEIECRLMNSDGSAFFFDGDGATPGVFPLNIIFNTMFWSFKLNDSEIYQGHGSQFFKNIDIMNDGASTSLGVSPIGGQNPYRILRLTNPLIVPATQTFSLDANFTTPASAALGYSTTLSLMYFYIKGITRKVS